MLSLNTAVFPAGRVQAITACVPNKGQCVNLSRALVTVAAIVIVATACRVPSALAQDPSEKTMPESERGPANRTAETIDPTTQSPALLWNRAELHRVHGDSLRAARIYDELENVAPSFHRVWLGRANLALESNDLVRAFECAEAFLQREPADEAGYSALARILDYSGRPREAAQAMLRVIQLTQRPLPEHYETCAFLYERAHQPAESIRILDLGADRLAPAPSLELHAVELLAKGGDYDAALRRLGALQQSGVRRDRILHVRGRVLAQSGRLLEAMIAWTDAIEYMSALPQDVRHRPITRQEKEELEVLLRDTQRELERSAQEGANLGAR